MRSDVDLLEAWQKGEEEAGKELFDRHFRQLYRFFRNKVRAGVDDLVQQTFLACLEGRQRLRCEASFRTYMYAAARRILYRSIARSQKEQANIDGGVSGVHEPGTGPESLVARKADQRMLLEAPRRVPIDFQIALELYYWEGMSGPQLAATLEIPEATVRGRIRRGLKHLRHHWQQLNEGSELLDSTANDLDSWARSLRELVGASVDPPPA